MNREHSILKKAFADQAHSSFAIPVLSTLLIVLWFVPDVFRCPIVFPFQTAGALKGAELLERLTPPVCGALLLLVFSVKGPRRILSAVSFFASLSAAVVLLFLGRPAFVLGPAECAATAAVLLCCAVFFRIRMKSDKLFFLAVTALPVAVWGYALYEIFSGAFPPVYLLPHKQPAALFAELSVCAISLCRFIES